MKMFLNVTMDTAGFDFGPYNKTGYESRNKREKIKGTKMKIKRGNKRKGVSEEKGLIKIRAKGRKSFTISTEICLTNKDRAIGGHECVIKILFGDRRI